MVETFTMLNGQVTMTKNPKLHNPSEEAVWLAAAINASSNQTILEAGTGTGAATFCLLARNPNLNITAIDISSEAIKTAKKNAVLNRKKNNITFIKQNFYNASKQTFDHVFTNPPFHSIEEGFNSLNGYKQASYGSSKENMQIWLNKLIELTSENGNITFIHHTKHLPFLLQTCNLGRKIVYLQTTDNKQAKRVLVQLQKGTNKVEEFTINCNNPEIRTAILENGESIWDVIKKQKNNP